MIYRRPSHRICFKIGHKAEFFEERNQVHFAVCPDVCLVQIFDGMSEHLPAQSFAAVFCLDNQEAYMGDFFGVADCRNGR